MPLLPLLPPCCERLPSSLPLPLRELPLLLPLRLPAAASPPPPPLLLASRPELPLPSPAPSITSSVSRSPARSLMTAVDWWRRSERAMDLSVASR